MGFEWQGRYGPACGVWHSLQRTGDEPGNRPDYKSSVCRASVAECNAKSRLDHAECIFAIAIFQEHCANNGEPRVQGSADPVVQPRAGTEIIEHDGLQDRLHGFKGHTFADAAEPESTDSRSGSLSHSERDES